MLRATKILNEFCFHFYDMDENWHGGLVVERLATAISSQLPKTVKILHLVIPVNDRQLETLGAKGFRLELLHLDCHCVRGERVVLRTFLEKQAPTLKLLWLNDGYPSTSTPVGLPRLHKLLLLEMGGTRINPFLCEDPFPKLRKLCLLSWKSVDFCLELFLHMGKVVTLRELILPSLIRNAQLVRRAAQCFPCLRVLRVLNSLDMGATLRGVFTRLTGLEALYVSIRQGEGRALNVEAILCGILPVYPPIQYGRLQNSLGGNIPDLQGPHFPSMLNLSRLRKLVLRTDAVLTDVSVNLLFMQLASLEEVYVERVAMSPRSMELLRDRLTFTFLHNDYVPLQG
jgi:hypothetical protein